MIDSPVQPNSASLPIAWPTCSAISPARAAWFDEMNNIAKSALRSNWAIAALVTSLIAAHESSSVDKAAAKRGMAVVVVGIVAHRSFPLAV